MAAVAAAGRDGRYTLHRMNATAMIGIQGMKEPEPPRGTLKFRSARSLLGRILTERASPARLGWAVALGVLIGTSPFYGFHLALCLVAATALRLNRTVTYLAANISLPWTAPLLIFSSVQLGNLLIAGRWLPMNLEAFGTVDPWEFAQAWLVGALVLGAGLGGSAGLLTYVAMRIHRRRHPLPQDPVQEALRRSALRFRAQGSGTFGYVRGKLEHDPVYRFLAEQGDLPEPILDLGCGRGQTLILLAEMRPGLRATGIDWDETKLSRARQAAAGLDGLSFHCEDVRRYQIPGARTLLLIDVLHYQDLPAQDEILRRAARALPPDGVLYIREVDASASWRSHVTRWQEKIGRMIRLNRGPTLCFRPAAQLREVLAAEGLVASLAPGSAGLPLSNVIIEARPGRSPLQAPRATTAGSDATQAVDCDVSRS